MLSTKDTLDTFFVKFFYYEFRHKNEQSENIYITFEEVNIKWGAARQEAGNKRY